MSHTGWPQQPRVLGKGDAIRAQMRASKAFNQNLAGLTKKQLARRERMQQDQLHNTRVNRLAVLMIGWFTNESEQPDREKQAAERLKLQAGIEQLLRTTTDQHAAAILEAAENAYEARVLEQQRARLAEAQSAIQVADGPIVRPHITPYTSEDMAAFLAASKE